MKTENTLIVAAFSVVISLQVCLAVIPAPLPEFKSKADTKKDSLNFQGSKNPNSEVFYTGKPFEIFREVYLFKNRTYRPEVVRWGSADPSGFPDGANNQTYLKSPLDSFDSTGFAITKIVNNITAESFLPCYATYDYDTMGSDNVYSIAGSELNQLHQGSDPDWDNSCALRMDLALYDYGNRYSSNTPGVYSGSLNGNYGSRYIISANGMKTYLNSSQSGFGSTQSDRTLGAGASGVNSLIQDMQELSSKSGKEVVALIVGSWHVAVITSSGYMDPHITEHDWSSTDAPKVWILE